MAKYTLTGKVAIAAIGGPEKRRLNIDGFWMDPTKPGRYLIEAIEPFISKRYPGTSGIPWGAQLRLSEVTTLVKMPGEHEYRPLTSVNHYWKEVGKRLSQFQISQEIKKAYKALTGKDDFPNQWVFNDFGHLAVRYFEDTNHNGKLDHGEHLEADMIHSTVENEFPGPKSKVLTVSHGCEHVKPEDMDLWVKLGFFKKGTVFQVHKYSETTPPGMVMHTRRAHGNIELHYYPGLKPVPAIIVFVVVKDPITPKQIVREKTGSRSSVVQKGSNGTFHRRAVDTR